MIELELITSSPRFGLMFSKIAVRAPISPSSYTFEKSPLLLAGKSDTKVKCLGIIYQPRGSGRWVGVGWIEKRFLKDVDSNQIDGARF